MYCKMALNVLFLRKTNFLYGRKDEMAKKMRKVILLLPLLLLAALSNVQAATVQINNQCKQDVHVWGYSDKGGASGSLLFDKNVVGKTSVSVNTTAGVQKLTIEYKQVDIYTGVPFGTVTNYRYYDGKKNLLIELTSNNSGACPFVITEY